MRIIHAHKYFYQRAGAERVMFALMQRQEEKGHVVAPFAMHHPRNEKTPYASYFISELETESGTGGWMHRVRSFGRAFWSLEAKRNMTRLILDFKPDIVHAHNLYTHLSPSVLTACYEAGIPVVMSIHDYALVSANYALWDGVQPMDIDHRSIFATARTRFIKGSFSATLALDVIRSLHEHFRLYDRYVTRYLAPSQFVKDVFVACGYDAKKIFIEPLFSDAPLQEPKEKDKGNVLFGGRLASYKGVDRLVQAMRLFPDTSLIIAGSGPEEVWLRKQVEGLRITFVGHLASPDLWKAMRQARVVVVPSVWQEPFGLVALEAMAQGTPVIVSDRGGLPEIVEDGISGSVFSAENIDALIDALRPYIEQPSYALKRGEAALERAKMLGNSEEFTERVLQHYLAV